MTDPARQERIVAASRALWPGLGMAGWRRAEMVLALEAADSIEPRPVYLTAWDVLYLLGFQPHDGTQQPVWAKLQATQDRA